MLNQIEGGARLAVTMLLLAGLAMVSLQARATPINAISFNVFDTNGTSTNTTRGFQFDVTQPGVIATALSFWDENGDGLNDSHDVGLWDPSGVLIASATVGSGTSASLLGEFRFVDIADVALAVATGYVVGAVFAQGSDDLQAQQWTGLVSAPGISYVGGRFINNGSLTLTRPTSSFSGLPGGSLLLGSNDVPERGKPDPMSDFIRSGEWGPGFNAQNEMLDEHAEKYGLEDQDWRPAKPWYTEDDRD